MEQNPALGLDLTRRFAAVLADRLGACAGRLVDLTTYRRGESPMIRNDTWSGQHGAVRPTANSAPALANASPRPSAPSIHNTQPWLFRPFPGGWTSSPTTPPARGHRPAWPRLRISVGAALLNLRLAILARGRTPLQQLLPDRRSRTWLR